VPLSKTVLRLAAWLLIAGLLAGCAPQSGTQLSGPQQTRTAAVALKATDQFLATHTAPAAPSATPTATSAPASTSLCSPQEDVATRKHPPC